MSDNNNASNLETVQLFDDAHRAADTYAGFGKARVQAVVDAVAKAAAERAEYYAEWAVRETGFGHVESKVAKNSCSLMTAEQDLGAFLDPQVDTEKKVVSFPKPAGVVVALIPSTNPVATVYYKVMISLMTRNAVILCPHPGAKACSIDAADFMAEAAVKVGAPRGLIQSVRQPNVALTNELMQSDRTSLILATGGPGMVRAAYSSSNPAIGVGPGNVACYVHSSADVPKAAERIVDSSSFDNSLPCTTESVIIADHSIADQLEQQLGINGGYMIKNPDEIQRIRQVVFTEDGHLNPAAIGKSAVWMAEKANVSVPANTRTLVIEIFTIGNNEPISKEKMCPLVGFHRINGGVQTAIRSALAMLDMQGKGHSAVVHAKDSDVTARYGAALPVCRVSVNVEGVFGSGGILTNLIPGLVIGTGFFGRSSIDENVGPKHLIQWTRLAYNKDPSEVMDDMEGSVATIVRERENAQPVGTSAAMGATDDQLRKMIKQLISEELRQMLTERF